MLWKTPPLERMRRNRHKARLREQQQKKKKEENKRYVCLFVCVGIVGEGRKGRLRDTLDMPSLEMMGRNRHKGMN